MGWSKTHDLAVKTGTYQKDGKEKNRYENVGMIMQSDDGGKLLLLKRTFNPAGVPLTGKGKDDMVTLAAFEVNRDDPKQEPRGKPGGHDLPFDDDIPF